MRSAERSGSNYRAVIDVIQNVAAGVDCVIIVPPFASVLRPALGPHVLQAVARRQGISVRVLYANAIFAGIVGIKPYEEVCDNTSQSDLVGERVFARVAHRLPPLGLTSAPFLTRLQVTAANQDPLLSSNYPWARTTLSHVERIEEETD